MKTLPAQVQEYSRSPTFDENTVPAALRKDHQTKAGVGRHHGTVRNTALSYQADWIRNDAHPRQAGYRRTGGAAQRRANRPGLLLRSLPSLKAARIIGSKDRASAPAGFDQPGMDGQIPICPAKSRIVRDAGFDIAAGQGTLI